ncbi:hypothetical protein LTR66_017919, partial [Elasticomyces elasticus]
ESQAFADAIDRDAYKGGIFRGMISDKTPYTKAIDILCASPAVRDDEKDALRYLKIGIDMLKGMYEAGHEWDRIFKMINLIGEKFESWYKADMKERGMYVAPTMIQITDKDGKIVKTVTVDMDGNSQTYQGGEYGRIPGAPQEFYDRQKKAAKREWSDSGCCSLDKKDRREAAKKTKKEEKKAKKTKHAEPKGESDLKPDGDEIGQTKGAEAARDEAKAGVEKTSRKKDNAFGDVFERNMRRGFLG